MNLEEWFKSNCDMESDYALITGASSGIGYEYLKKYSSIGFKCIATSIDQEELSEVVNKVQKETGNEIVQIVADLSNRHGIEKLVSETQKYNIASLVNNAGFGLKGPFLSHSADVYESLINLNTLAPTLNSLSIIPGMVAKKRGLVIHVASINACTPIAYNSVYTATKAYLLYYSYAVSYELKNSGILFQTVLPGTTKTPFHERQGAVPQSMYMEPDLVVKRSTDNISKLLSISNRMDRLLFPIISAIPMSWSVRIGTYLLKKRLKIAE